MPALADQSLSSRINPAANVPFPPSDTFAPRLWNSSFRARCRHLSPNQGCLYKRLDTAKGLCHPIAVAERRFPVRTRTPAMAAQLSLRYNGSARAAELAASNWTPIADTTTPIPPALVAPVPSRPAPFGHHICKVRDTNLQQLRASQNRSCR